MRCNNIKLPNLSKINGVVAPHMALKKLGIRPLSLTVNNGHYSYTMAVMAMTTTDFFLPSK